jgi:alpha-L-fucosidase
MGAWLATNGEAIYGCGGTAWGKEFGEYGTVNGKRKFIAHPAIWRSTTKPGKVFVHVFQWPQDGKLELPALQRKIAGAHLLADPSTKVRVDQTPERITLTLPQKAPDPVASVVCLSL